MYNGIVNIYKEQGFTSHDVVAKLRGIYGQKKIGHTGTLDPMAEGVLIVCLGQATKLSDLILTKDKSYVATMRLGMTFDTDDTTGNIKKQCEASKLESLFSDIDSFRQRLIDTFQSFLGKSMQVPPMYSAIKINGKKLYEYARAGIDIKPDSRPIEIYELELIEILDNRDISFRIKCSKGTYVRSLIRDIGESLGVGAAMSGLLRDEVNGIKSEDGYRISDLEKLKAEGGLEETVLPMEKLLSQVPCVKVKEGGQKYLQNGNRLSSRLISSLEGKELDPETLTGLKETDFIRVYSDNELRALYSYDDEKKDFKVFKML